MGGGILRTLFQKNERRIWLKYSSFKSTSERGYKLGGGLIV
nr:MAG TPA: hypothetical protein [Caudoviricetes sp.]